MESIEALWAKGGSLSPWIFIAFLIVVLLVATRILRGVINMLARKATPEKQVWRNAILVSMNTPLNGFIWITVCALAVRGFYPMGVNETIDASMPPIYQVLCTTLVTWFLLRLVNNTRKNMQAQAVSRGGDIDQTAAEAISKLAWVVILAAATLVVMQTLGLSIAGLLAFGGAAGIAVGFAAQNLVSNLFGGLTVFASRIFKIGEYIIIPGTSLMGEVKHIGWRSTLVMGFDRKPFYIPNALFNSSTVINHSRMDRRCIEQTIHMRYQDIDKVEAVIRRGNELITSHKDIDQEFFVFRFNNYGERSLELFLYAFPLATGYVDYMVLKEELSLNIARIIREEGGEVMPVTNIHMPEADLVAEQTRQAPATAH
ncbi:mechanosensitive ion channel family protein [Marinobacter piscensis]|uniref:mechanosensitive ion channel family protein n=1 Tax=Marinobacter piscensis TaxID=1562308 RepID=UPI0016429FED|nr:mechanosensitive ion channel family protein [Marinobacter piscensis]